VLTRALGSPVKLCVLGALCLTLAACGSSSKPPIVCGGTNGGQCTNPNSLLYATTTSNQILPFSINTNSGALAALTPASGPANSNSIANTGLFLMFADPSTNEVDSNQINGDGTLMSVPGSPFALGTAAGGPTGILAVPFGFFYATEPDGTIVGFTAPGNGTLTGSVPGSPFAAGIAPEQMAVASLSASALTPYALYATGGGPSGGILGYTVNSAGSLNPINGSPFSVSPDWSAGSILVSSPYVFVLFTSNAAATNFGEVAALSIDVDTGALTPVPESPFSVGNAPVALAADSSNHLFVLNSADHTISAFSIGSNGVLTAIGTPAGAGTATGGMALLPPYLYVADTNASRILIFHIDPSTGAVTTAGSMSVASPPLQLTVVSFPGL
jgi:6-phosphogluconolactonase (cycloisomerase 2 family)